MSQHTVRFACLLECCDAERHSKPPHRRVVFDEQGCIQETCRQIRPSKHCHHSSMLPQRRRLLSTCQWCLPLCVGDLKQLAGRWAAQQIRRRVQSQSLIFDCLRRRIVLCCIVLHQPQGEIEMSFVTLAADLEFARHE